MENNPFRFQTTNQSNVDSCMIATHWGKEIFWDLLKLAILQSTEMGIWEIFVSQRGIPLGS